MTYRMNAAINVYRAAAAVAAAEEGTVAAGDEPEREPDELSVWEDLRALFEDAQAGPHELRRCRGHQLPPIHCSLVSH